MSENNKRRRMIHHEMIRVPIGWKEQDKALIVQLNRIFDDIYNKIGLITEAQKERDSGGNADAGS